MHTPMTSSTTIRSGLGIFALGLISVAVLNACGGGDPVKVPVAQTTSTIETYLTSSGSTTATFAANANLRYLIQGPGKDTVGAYSNTALLDQNGSGTAADIDFGPSGAVIRLGASTLADVSASDKYAVQKIKGDTYFAQGRWSKGAVNNAGGSVTLTGTSNQAFHYLAFNALNAFPVGAVTKNCARLYETGATYVGDTRVGETTTVGVAGLGGQVQIVFDGLGNADVPINVVVASKYPSPSLNSVISENFRFTLADSAPASAVFQTSRNYSVPGLGNMAILGAGDALGNGAVILLGVGYRIQLDNGYNFQGLLSMSCS